MTSTTSLQTPSTTTLPSSPSSFHTTNRPDGRIGNTTLRPLSAELSCLSKPDGSCKFSSGHTTILAAVYGPAPPRISSRERSQECVLSIVLKQGMIHTSSTANVSTATNSTSSTTNNNADVSGCTILSTPSDREMERFLLDSLTSCIQIQQYPRCVIEIVIQVIQNDGSMLGSCFNASVLALLDAGIYMNSMPIAVTFLVQNSNFSSKLPIKNDDGNRDAMMDTDTTHHSALIKLDPSSEEESYHDYSTIILVLNSSSAGSSSSSQHDIKNDNTDSNIITCMTFGKFDLTSYLSCAEIGRKASVAILMFIRMVIEQKVVRESQTLWSI